MKLHEYEPLGGQSWPRAIHREGSSVLTCAACGCRLLARESLSDGGGYGPDAAWRHYEGNTRTPTRAAAASIASIVPTAWFRSSSSPEALRRRPAAARPRHWPPS